MIMEWMLLLAAMLTMFLLAKRNGGLRLGLALFSGDPDADMKIIPEGAMQMIPDEDMRIATGKYSRQNGEEAEAAAQEYLKQKKLGNIKQARALGQAYSDEMVKISCRLLARESAGDETSSRILHQKILLLSYVINRIIADKTPNSILAQTAINVFYSALEQTEPNLHQHACDMAAYSLYILCERSHKGSDGEIGQVYAGLCGFGDDPARVQEGQYLYTEYYASCEKIFDTVEFAD